MKLDLLATTVGVDATELASTLKLEDGATEVSSEVAKKQLDNYIANLKIAEKKAGVKEGEGKAERLHKSATEKLLKDFGIEGDKYDDLFANLKVTLDKKKSPDESILQKAHNTLKDENKLLKRKLKTIEDNATKAAEQAEIRTKVLGKVTDVIDQFTYPSAESRATAIDLFMTKKFVSKDADIFLEVGDKVETDFTDVAKSHFGLFGTVAKKEDKKPPIVDFNKTDYKGTVAELNKMLIKATTMEEKAAIKKKLEEKLAESK